ncbi:16S rRNA methyltransferase [Pseudoalteromonas rubra]|uniref:Ribosomal RNA small subunit methyltransferase C n=1 Tax=Pseudoalteromonas rubra TaxID=43658 RepID=A0A5S3WSL3_9GAMM|nr:methyltransferase [Pseudoalteromonas rubra]TMP31412.1 16S rRNA methyltransferase [Pseudoalteromonas rubra]TMP34496.1 16S rRNA methyltransferase [Pseudoalteromonas rubra]
MQKLTNPSLLLLRNEEELTGQHILVINHQRDGFLSELKQLNPQAVISAFSYDFADHLAADSVANINSYVSHSLPELNDLDLIIYYYPKSKPEAQMMFDNIRALCSEQTRLLVVGENKGGVKSAEKQLQDKCEAHYKLDSAKHCILYEFAQLQTEALFDIASYQQTFTVTVAGQQFDAVSVPGVFNHGKLDVGTKLLLENLDLPAHGNMLDFGCGAGIIATFVLNQSPRIRFSCLDVNALALYACEQTLRLNGHKAELVLSDGLKQLKGRFDAIISNPPFHTGIKTDYDIAEGFINGATMHMNKGAQLHIVANSFLKYPPLIEARFGHCDTQIKNTKFAVYRATLS